MRQCKPQSSPARFQTSPYKCSTHLGYLKVWERGIVRNWMSSLLIWPHQLRAAVQHCVSLGFGVLFVLCLSRVSSAELPLLNFMGPIKVKQLLLKNDVSVLVSWCTPVLLQGWVSWSFILPVVSMSDTHQCLSSLLEQIHWYPKGKRHQLCSSLQGLLQTDRIDVEDTKCIFFNKDSASALFHVRQ